MSEGMRCEKRKTRLLFIHFFVQIFWLHQNLALFAAALRGPYDAHFFKLIEQPRSTRVANSQAALN